MRKTGRSVPDLTTKGLRAFVAAAALGSVSRTGALLGRSESAVSLQITALERDLGAPLFERTGRGLKLTAFGMKFLVHAEDILARVDTARRAAGEGADAVELRVGVVQDLLSLSLPIVLEAAAERDPAPCVTVSTGTSAEMAVALGEGRLDLALLARRHVEPDTILTLPMAWLAAPAFFGDAPLPLVAVAPPCPFLDAARRALDHADMTAELRVVSPNLEAARLAARQGAGVLCRTALAADEDLGDAGARLGLPPLPGISYVLETSRDAGHLAHAVAECVKAELPPAVTSRIVHPGQDDAGAA